MKIIITPSRSETNGLMKTKIKTPYGILFYEDIAKAIPVDRDFFLGGLLSNIGSLAKQAWGGIRRAGKYMFRGGKQLFSTLGSGLSYLGQGVGNVISGIGSGLGSGANMLGSGFMTGLNQPYQTTEMPDFGYQSEYPVPSTNQFHSAPMYEDVFLESEPEFDIDTSNQYDKWTIGGSYD